MKNKGIRTRLLVCALVLLFIAIVVVSVVLVRYRLAYKADSDMYTELKTASFNADERKVDIEGLRKINPDTAGWLEACDGKVSGPVVSSKDDEYYLNHRFDKAEAGSGTFFADRFTDPPFKSPITIIYGHNMKDGSMFHELTEYKNASFLADHDSFTIYTEKGPEKYRIFSVFYADYYDIPWIAERCRPGSDRVAESLNYKSQGGLEMADFIKTVQKRSLHPVDISEYEGLENEAKLAVLCTCEYSDANNRFLVYGIHIS